MFTLGAMTTTLKKFLLSSATVLAFTACSSSTSSSDDSDLSSSSNTASTEALQKIYDSVEKSGVYTAWDSVAAYLCRYDELPSNYVNKAEGKKMYESETGNTFSKWNFNPWETIGVMIGGDVFDNFEDNTEYEFHSELPEGSYREADVGYFAENRGTKRLVYQPGCLIYYTTDHYETFTLLEFENAPKSSSSEKAESSSSEVDLKAVYKAVKESGKYTTRDSVAAYLCKFDKLPTNYVDAAEGEELYESETGNSFTKWNFNPWETLGVMIGGEAFINDADDAKNYHSEIPEGDYSQADVAYFAENRGTRRLVYQSGCVIYYTSDFFKTFTQMDFGVETSADAKSSSSEKEAASSSSVAASSSSEEVDLKAVYKAVEESGKYTTRDSVAAYFCKFEKVPSNYVNAEKGKELYESETGNSFTKWNFNPWTTLGVMIGGDEFVNDSADTTNYHSAIPEGTYVEVDVQYTAENRGRKRLLLQPSCVVYYTHDYYETITQIEFSDVK